MSQIASMTVVQSQAACQLARAGAYLLAPAQALALHPKEASRLRITCGSAWVTINDGLDYFLTAEQEMTMPAGSRVVMESMHRGGQLKFDWQPVMQMSRERSSLRGLADQVFTESCVSLEKPSSLEPSPQESSPQAQALRDLRGAAVLAARGLAGLATALAAGFARGLGVGFNALARSAHSKARAAQGRMASCESIASSGAV